jgi:dienelactone hydrolase
VSAHRIALALVVLLAGCAPLPRDRTGAGDCEHSHDRVGGNLCEDVYWCARPPGGRFDRIGLRRLAPCAGARGAVILYLPGAHMNGTPSARRDLRTRLAARGLRTWALDYRTHSVPAHATAEELATLSDWTADVFADDAAWAADFVRELERERLVVAGFSYGASIAYRLAARDVPLAGLVILDGAPPDGAPLRERAGPAIDVGSNRLPFAERRRLLAAVAQDPGGPSPVAGYPSAEAALADVVYTSRSFGGRGGLSAARDGVTDVRDLAALLATYDRWWPSAALGGSALAPSRRVPVLAFAAANMGPRWVERVRAGAQAWGGAEAIAHELPGYGHVDVLVGRETGRLVVDPVVAFVLATTD